MKMPAVVDAGAMPTSVTDFGQPFAHGFGHGKQRQKTAHVKDFARHITHPDCTPTRYRGDREQVLKPSLETKVFLRQEAARWYVGREKTGRHAMRVSSRAKVGA